MYIFLTDLEIVHTSAYNGRLFVRFETFNQEAVKAFDDETTDTTIMGTIGGFLKELAFDTVQ